MPRIVERPWNVNSDARPVTPSIVDPAFPELFAEPFTLDQELKPFGKWSSDPIWVPPKDAAAELAETMVQQTRPFASRRTRWDAVVKHRRGDFTQVRELDLFQASIRLPQGKFYVTVTEQKDFDKIEETIPACVQTRLDEFLAGPHMRRGAKVYYIKPLCVEVGDALIMTTGEDLAAAIAKVQGEVFAKYRWLALKRRPVQAMTAAVNAGLAVSRAIKQRAMKRRERALNAYQAQLEFERRKLALSVVQNFSQVRTSGCSFAETLALTTPLNRTDVIEQFCLIKEVSRGKRDELLMIAAGTIPWFMGLSMTISYLSTVTLVTVATPPVVACDPAFVAELPGSRGASSRGIVLNIGHFDEVAGVTHVEI
jgi:hypothetical protein